MSLVVYPYRASAFDQAVMLTIKEEVKAKDYRGLKFLLENFSNEKMEQKFVKRSPDLCIEVVNLMCKARQNKQILNDILTKTMKLFYSQQVFKESLGKPMSIIGGTGTPVHFNKTLLKWCAQTFYKDVKLQNNISSYSFDALVLLKDYLYSNKLSPASLPQLVELYDLSSIYDIVELENLCHNAITNQVNQINDQEALLDFIEVLKDKMTSEYLSDKFELHALTVFLTNQKIEYHPSLDNKHISLAASHLIHLTHQGAYGDLLRKYVTGMLISKSTDLEQALLHKFMPSELKQRMKEISYNPALLIKHHQLKPLLADFPQAVILNLSLPYGKNCCADSLTKVQSQGNIEKQLPIRLTCWKARLDCLNLTIDENEEVTILAKMSPIECDFPLKLHVKKSLKASPEDLSAFSNYTIKPIERGWDDRVGYIIYSLAKKGV